MRDVQETGRGMTPVFNVDVDRFAKDIQEVKRESGRSTEEMLKYTMILMLQAGRNATPQGRKNRSLVTRDADTREDKDDAPVFGITDNEPGVRFFQVWKQGAAPKKVFVPHIPRRTKNNADVRAAAIKARDAIVAKFKKITYSGIAKASWGWAMNLIGEHVSGAAVKGVEHVVTSNKQIFGSSPFIEVENKLGWILKIAPDIEQRMISSASARLEKWLERRWQTGIDRAERRGA